LPSSISVVIPSLQGGRHLCDLVSRLLERPSRPTEVLVADNGLPEETVAALRATGAEVVPMGRNLGFGAAVNAAARCAQGDALVVLNDDMLPAFPADFLGPLAGPLGGDVGMVAGVLVQEARPELIESAGIELDAALNPLDYLFGEPVSRLDEPLSPPLGPCGGAAAFGRELFAELGGFDEGFFAYFEDVDLALRLRAAGARCALAPSARALHSGSGTLGSHTLRKAVVVGHSRGYFLRKWGVLRRPAVAARVLPVETAACLLLARRHRSLAPARARAQGWRACRTRAAWPAGVPTIGLLDGLRRRYARSTPAGSTTRRGREEAG